MIDHQPVEEMNIVLSQSAQIKKSVDIGGLEGQLCQTYPASVHLAP
jgi:hypothetical protein